MAVCMGCGGTCSWKSQRCGSCAARERWRLLKATGSAAYPSLTCKRCGKAFAYAGSRRAYCSAECRRSRVTKACAGCGVVFDVAVSNDARYNYCTLLCKRAHSSHRWHDCDRCGARFWGAPARRYCSEACYRPPTLLRCVHCERVVRITPTDAVRRRYCSRRCYLASGAETSIEARTREALEAFGLPFVQEAPVGRWVVDFLVGGTLVVECDGRYWHANGRDTDARKTAALEAHGLTVWRLPEAEIKRADYAVRLTRRLLDYVAGADVGWQPAAF